MRISDWSADVCASDVSKTILARMREGCRRVEAPSGNGLDGRSVGGRRIPERFTIALPPARDVKLLLTIMSYFEARGPAAGRVVGVQIGGALCRGRVGR